MGMLNLKRRVKRAVVNVQRGRCEMPQETADRETAEAAAESAKFVRAQRLAAEISFAQGRANRLCGQINFRRAQLECLSLWEKAQSQDEKNH